MLVRKIMLVKKYKCMFKAVLYFHLTTTARMKKYDKLLYALALLRLILPYLLQNPAYEPHRDEFLYLAEGNHLAWGFMEVPPLLSIFAWLTHFFGDGLFWIKLWPSLFGVATFIIAGKIVLSLGGRDFSLWLLFLSFTFTVYLRLFFLFQPNPPEVFFWTMIVYSLIRYAETHRNKWLYVFGISVGLGMLSKYSVAFYTVSVLGGVLLTKHRTFFTNKHFWIAALAGLSFFCPTYYGNIRMASRYFTICVSCRKRSCSTSVRFLFYPTRL